MSRLRLPIRFTGLNRAMALLGMAPRNSFVELDDHEVDVRMGWAFRTRIPRSSIRSAAEHHGTPWGFGVHGWRGRWLVNGSSKGLVRIEIAPATRARVLGVPVTLRELTVAMADPAELIEALGSGGSPTGAGRG